MLEWIAVVSMLLDHLGAVFFPDDSWLRLVGRLAMPIYCFGIVRGYTHTRNVNRYMGRLLFLALLSQIPFSLAFHVLKLNVIFTLLIGLLFITILDRKQIRVFQKIILLSVLTVFTLFIPMDYGWYGIALIVLFRFVPLKRVGAAHLFLNLIFCLMYGWNVQFYSFLSTILIFGLQGLKFNVKINRTFYRFFYPSHLSILFLVEVLKKVFV